MVIDRLLLRPAEVAVSIGVCRDTVYSMIRSGELPSVRFGTSVRVPSDELRAFLAARTHRVGPPPETDIAA